MGATRRELLEAALQALGEEEALTDLLAELDRAGSLWDLVREALEEVQETRALLHAFSGDEILDDDCLDQPEEDDDGSL